MNVGAQGVVQDLAQFYQFNYDPRVGQLYTPELSGLFSSIGKGLKSIGKTIGGAVKDLAPTVAPLAVGAIPGAGPFLAPAVAAGFQQYQQAQAQARAMAANVQQVPFFGGTISIPNFNGSLPAPIQAGALTPPLPMATAPTNMYGWGQNIYGQRVYGATPTLVQQQPQAPPLSFVDRVTSTASALPNWLPIAAFGLLAIVLLRRRRR